MTKAAARDPLLGGPLDDPYPLYSQLRRAGRLLPHPSGLWIAPHYAECDAILRDRRFETVDPRAWQETTVEAPAESPLREAMRRSLLFAPPDRHARVRNRLTHAFTPKAVEPLRAVITRTSHALLDRALRAESFDLIEEYASALPVLTMADLLGIPAEDRDQFAAWSRDIGGIIDPVVSEAGIALAIRVLREFSEYVAGLIALRRRAPGPDLISRLAQRGALGEEMTDEEVVANCGFLLAAGHGTTTNFLGNAFVALARDPNAWRTLRTSPGIIPAAVEELLRFDGPAQMTARRALEDVEIAGVPLRKGRRILLLLASANRDPTKFKDPDRLDFARPENPHLAFGAGVHFCLGAPLARLEAQVALETLVARVPGLEVDTARVAWNATVSLRGPQRLTAWQGRPQ